MATKIFSSYAHKDARFVDQLKMHLSPLKHLGEDARITPEKPFSPSEVTH